MQRATYGCYALTVTSWSCNCCKALNVPRRSSWHWKELKLKPTLSDATCCLTA
ncbi:Signal transduction histidine kinase [Pseudomonas syringae pv. actinidiae]|uniref:Signal transduction histidine kinase n=1 Tax=Pseudomonas syringae pv. actinidiae TaxID=103796 RepID=A0A2V0QN45_PSESF|nr:Signal transduction histidine kinase [Pseudomonas syringae pv. actinidiae]